MQKQSTKPSNSNCDEHDHGVQFKFEYKYCPMCATEMEWRHVFGAQRQQCPNCGWVHFRNLKVGAGVLAERDGKVVLARRGINPGKNKWCFPSGFVEYNESPEMGAVREFKEETGLDVEITGLLDVVYYNADFRGAGIMVLYGGKVIGGTPTPMDDVVEVGLFRKDEIPADDEIAFESNRIALAKWKNGRE